ncbi:TraB/GumN family protein [Lysobacter sp. Root690]|uniref:TraB/GumN family protein n=1 Tax=Lysobacter sp. Root690 TaxID=1736588 RepID=UPI0006F93780|nr:TraB/GumN family protein [Lysobacter sp. Root690]KRB02316.1 polysaccharide biosynthesis protein GumN [Lysobacter sp. Root690]
MRRALIVLALLALLPGAAAAQTAPTQPAAAPPSGDIRDFDTLVVTGEQPGPGLWKVMRGGHVLWILGTLSPLPKDMTWLSRQVEATIAESQEVIAPPSVSFGTELGVVRTMMLIPTALKARKNPDGKTLQEVVPADLYARWTTLKARYIGRDGGVEKWRPIFAAQELYEAAIKQSGMSLKGVVQPVVDKAAKQHDVPITEARVTLKIDDPKATLKEFSASALDDRECFAKTLSRIESDLESMRARGNAWAIGDIATLRTLPQGDQYRTCLEALAATGVAKRLNLGDLRQRVTAQWLERAEDAIAKNNSTFATLPVADLLETGGLLDKLRAAGYTVEDP